MQVFYLVVTLILGTIHFYRSLTQKPVKATEEAVSFSCVEFNSDEDAARFHQSGVIPAGSKKSNKSGSECTGVSIAAK